jgi:hypothetical protein
MCSCRSEVFSLRHLFGSLKSSERNRSMNTPHQLSAPLKWHGGKSYLADWIISQLPAHVHYVETYAGGLAVLLAKDPEGVSEVVNDVDGELTTFWSVLKDDVSFESLRDVWKLFRFRPSSSRRLRRLNRTTTKWNGRQVLHPLPSEPPRPAEELRHTLEEPDDGGE